MALCRTIDWRVVCPRYIAVTKADSAMGRVMLTSIAGVR
jgi:hypothetical protein